MAPIVTYDIVRLIAYIVTFGAVVAFLVTYLRRVTRHKGLLRTMSVIALACALVILLFVRSPLDYRATAPAPTDAKWYMLSNTNDLFALRATDGSRIFIRHLPGAQGQGIAYDTHGLLIMSTYGQGFLASTKSGGSVSVSVNTMRAFRGDDGADALPALRALANITASTVDGNVLYVAAIDDLAHKDAETLRAFSLPDGAELWHSALTTTAQPSIWGIDQGMLYIQLDATIAAVRTADGAMIWQSPPLATRWGHIEKFAPPQNGGVYMWAGGDAFPEDASLVKLDARDGSRKWALSGVTFSGVTSGVISGNRLYGIRNAKLTAFDISSGAQVWQQQGVEILHNESGGITTTAGILYVVGRRAPVAGQHTDVCDVFAIRVSDNAELWRQPPHVCTYYTLSLLDANGMLYYMTFDGSLTAFRAADGAVLWTHTGYVRGGMFTHWNDMFAVEAVLPGVAFIDSDHLGVCQFLVLGCDPDAGHYLEAVDPATGALYWRYSVDDITSSLFDDGSA